MRGLGGLTAMAALIVLLCMPAALARESKCQGAEEALQKASVIRGLAVLNSVPCKIEDREGVRRYLLETISKQLPPERLQSEELVYREIGLLPRDYDYAHGIVELYLSQIGAYYDPERNHYVMASWLSSELQDDITIHELTHALQDQHYNLEKVIDHKVESGDYLLARAALVEGDATFVMLDYSRGKAGGSGKLSDFEVQAFTAGGVLDAALKASTDSAPKSLQLILVFPYTSGLRFVHHLAKEKGFAGLKDAYASPPNTTEEILHPEKYLSGKRDYIEFTDEHMRGDVVSQSARRVYQDTLGEFGVSALLSSYHLERVTPSQVGAGWGGDKAALYDEAGKRIIVWRSNWDSEEDAKEFLDAYHQVLLQSYPSIKAGSPEWSPGARGNSAKISRNGREVLVVIRL
ncbi:MAG: hypothetical protein J5J00_00860 [Deltaproteobacteria bacterium]|nr:hypothetical protein [Deltaproteobacteria bacterium]